VALEWINRLRDLIFYWKYRHRVDANQEIELAQAARPRLTPQTRVHDFNEEAPPNPPIDLSIPYPAMDRLYNWCVLEGCRPIVKGGRLYMKKGLRGQFKSVDIHLFFMSLYSSRVLQTHPTVFGRRAFGAIPDWFTVLFIPSCAAQDKLDGRICVFWVPCSADPS
jgi:hypothetical protein